MSSSYFRRFKYDRIDATSVSIHRVRFEVNSVTSQERAICSCGWSYTTPPDPSPEEIEKMQRGAAIHDLLYDEEKKTSSPSTYPISSSLH